MVESGTTGLERADGGIGRSFIKPAKTATRPNSVIESIVGSAQKHWHR